MRFASLAFTALPLVLGFVGCGSSDDTNGTSTSSSSGSSSSSSGSGSSSSGGGSSSGSSGGGSTPVPAAECSARCAAKLEECGLTASVAKQSCDEKCAAENVNGDQLLCWEFKGVGVCKSLIDARTIGTACPDTSAANKVDLGAPCTCPGETATSEGSCAGSRTTCKLHLSCLYMKGSSGAGVCVGLKCCDAGTDQCDANPSLLRSCKGVGTCQKNAQGYYCSK